MANSSPTIDVPEKASARERVNILLVDDEPANLLSLEAILDDLGHNLVKVHSGDEALRRLLSSDFAVILLDVQMQGLDGFETAKLIRGREKHRHTPIIFLTAYDINRLPVEEAYALGAVDYLIKPLVPVILRAKVAGFVELFERAEQIKRQAERIRQMERRELERKLAEESARLRESEQRFARFTQHLPGLAWIKDLQGRYVYANDAALEAFGTSQADLYGKTDDQVFPAETAESFRANDHKAVAGGKGVLVIEKLMHEDGVLHPSIVSKFPILGSNGEVALVGGMAIDISERMQAEERLKLSLALLDTLQRNAPVGFAFVDHEFRFLRINDALAAINGLPEADHIGLTVSEVVPQLWPKLEPLYRGVLETGQPVINLELSGETAAAPGETRDWLVNYYPVRVHDEIVGIGILVTDITERKRMEDELRLRAEQLQEADRRKDEFLATLAHELRNPLAPISNALQLIARAGSNPALLENARKVMERQLQQLVRLVDDLLDVSRITRGKIELRKAPIELAAAVRNAVETSRPFIEQCGHELTVVVPPEPIYLEADLIRVAQVLSNLLNNAAKYTEKGGKIELIVEREKNDAAVTVRDNGVGIPPAMLDHIFEMFAQVDGSLERAQGGLGIGLTIVRRLVEMHGGSVQARSQGHRRGSEFIIRLPALETHPRLPREQGGADVAMDKTPLRRILVVDDNRDSVASLQMMLQLMGHQVHTAHDGLAAVAAAAALELDVVLLDIGMPGLNGYDAARRIREQPRSRRILLVAVTGWGQDEDKRRAREAGFDHHMVKPVDPAVLAKILRESKKD